MYEHMRVDRHRTRLTQTLTDELGLTQTEADTHRQAQSDSDTYRLAQTARQAERQTNCRSQLIITVDRQTCNTMHLLRLLVAYTRLGATICGQHMPDVQQSTTVVKITPSDTVASDKAPSDTVLSSLMYSASSNMSSRGSFSMDCTVIVMRAVQTAAIYIPDIYRQQQSQRCTLLDTSDLQRFELGRVSSSPEPSGPP